MTDAPSPADPPRPRPRLRRRLQWLILPLLALAASEGVARAWLARVSGRTFLDRAERAAREGPIDVLLLGSSRVAASVDRATFASELARARGRPARVVNMGTGYASLVEHDLALRAIGRDFPGALRGAWVLVEAPGGIPDGLAVDLARWDDPWSYEGQALRLSPLLRPVDVPALWRSGFDYPEKVRFTALALGHRSALVAHREVLAESLFDGLRARASALLLGRRPGGAPADLATEGGIRADPEAVLRNRKLAEDLAARWSGDQRPLGPSWDGRVIGSIVRRVRALGGHVAFFEVPLHSTQARVLQTGLRLADRRAFRDQARRWGTPLIRPDFAAPDADFPDIWHLARSRSPEFTRALARAWLDLE